MPKTLLLLGLKDVVVDLGSLPSSGTYTHGATSHDPHEPPRWADGRRRQILRIREGQVRAGQGACGSERLLQASFSRHQGQVAPIARVSVRCRRSRQKCGDSGSGDQRLLRGGLSQWIMERAAVVSLFAHSEDRHVDRRQ